MKKKLTRSDFAGLRQHYPVLSTEEMRRYVAGHSDFYDENGIFLSNPYSVGIEMGVGSLGHVKEEKAQEDNVGSSTFPFENDMINNDIAPLSANAYDDEIDDDWFYYGFGGYDPDGNYHWYSGYSQDDFYNWDGDWPGGWVYGIGYVGPEIVIYGDNNNGYINFEDYYFRYDFVEGMGAGATYKGDIYVQEQNGILNIICNVDGIPGYSSTYDFKGMVEIYVNGNKVKELYLTKGGGAYFVEQGSIYVGSAMVDLTQYHGHIVVKVATSGGRGDSYTGYSAVNGSTTVYDQYR